MELVGLTEELFGLCKVELDIFFYLPSCVKRPNKSSRLGFDHQPERLDVNFVCFNKEPNMYKFGFN